MSRVPQSYTITDVDGKHKTYSYPFKESFEIDRAGYIYILCNKAWEGWHKIGRSKNVRSRLQNFNGSSPYKDYTVPFTINHHNVNDLEKKIHQKLFNLGYRGGDQTIGTHFKSVEEGGPLPEWWKISHEKLVNLIEKTIDPSYVKPVVAPLSRKEYEKMFELVRMMKVLDGRYPLEHDYGC